MEKNILIILAILSGVAMLETTFLAVYAIHTMRKFKKAIYEKGYYKGFVERELFDRFDRSKEDSGMRKDCIHCEACSRHEPDSYECPDNCFQYEGRATI